jgi:hypothetical protein
MRVKTQHYLQPNVTDAHCVVIEDSLGNIIYVALETANGQIVTAQAGEPNFAGMLKALGIEKQTAVYDIKPKSIEEMKSLF